MDADTPGGTRLRGVDLALIAAVAVALVAIHVVVPPSARSGLALHHDAVDPLALYTGAFVHLDLAHLLGNVGGFVAAALVAYGLCVQAGRRRWFLVTFAGFLLVLPVAVSLTSYAVLGAFYPWIDPVSRGFSGVGAGFAGFVFVALLAVLGRRYGFRIVGFVGLGVWLLLLLEVYLIYAGRVSLAVGGLVVIGWTACLWGLRRELAGPPESLRRRIEDELPHLLQVGLVVLLLVSFVSVLFPATIVDDGAVTDVFAHAAGFLYGLGGATLTHRYVSER
ncbi:hypothetical protein [Halorientalis halophila]|uniref:hypothetical protein n=1 Tax=Halorientalis halophila TaxID=3108499 RepID=UPI00300870F6